ncbi:hypothetical protein FQN50_004025 [Emmonsiellopsis sp. PD_5]|nr:hypothetical protein FQN50_004025 [Emmonsiellopsis sp. PD_5]
MSTSSSPGAGTATPSLFGGPTQEPDHLEYEEEWDAQPLPPPPDASDDGTYETENESLPDARKDTAVQEGEDEQPASNEEYYSSDTSSVPERPNRYRGPPSTWRAQTRRERQETTALEALRARDLSIHLFNAFALRRRAREMGTRNFSGRDPDAAATEESGAEDISSQFVPPKRWAAWPMPADEVPRGDEHVQTDENEIWTVKGPSDGRPSAELEECLMAHMLKVSKERFESRQWGRRPRAYRRGASKGAAASDTDGGVTSSGKEESGDETVGGYPITQYRPVILADDEKARKILRPATRHILGDLDGLLMGLHHARQAYVTTMDFSQSEYDTEAEDGMTSRSRSRSRNIYSRNSSRSRGARASRNSSRNRVPPAAAVEIDGDEMDISDNPDAANSQPNTPTPKRKRSNTPARSRSRSPGSRQSKLGLRDWSDIVGIASMTGWPSSVVMRTAQRCSQLFGEDMAFRTLNEGKLDLCQTTDNGQPAWEYHEADEVSGEELTEAEIPKPEIASRTTGAGRGRARPRANELYCPVKGCSRETKGFSRTWNLNQHLKTKHPTVELRGRRRVKAEASE